MKFHYCLGYIHQVASRCRDWSGETNTTGALRSSLELSAQASICSLELSRAAQLTLDREKFWVLCFYLASALLNLFLKILIDPFVQESSTHLKILKDAPLFLSEVDTRHLTSTETEHLGLIVVFSQKLVAIADESTSNRGTDERTA
ncbi:uncharacterized protein EURHEDRAFT_466178 [Aspergillus ruber CBS 135680]|uniref:Uncharacterized protein n=1 Tax=Aspergillus ruber (strain CBS 135680) TaxID=1388766 RepID=A0A017S1F4_ASPRC|nr:uncharacterized protein EURHEDRAFT_466178 [Aspergillus ruber CBS 135680]EYE90883.1 hypothetical protein EURHEDRAFT_466178 [Aspergillus ruber CBS 135680]